MNMDKVSKINMKVRPLSDAIPLLRNPYKNPNNAHFFFHATPIKITVFFNYGYRYRNPNIDTGSPVNIFFSQSQCNDHPA